MAKNKIESITSVYNDVELVGIALESIKDHMDKIHIVEGSWFPNQPLRSNDGTIDIIEDFKKRNPDKVEIYYHDYNPNIFCNQAGLSNPNAIGNAMAARQLAFNNVQSEWAFTVDSDEIYIPEELDNLLDFLDVLSSNSNEAYIVNIPAFVFYFSENFGCIDDFNKVYRILEHPPILTSEDLFSFHRTNPPKRENIPGELLTMYHYSYLTSKRVETKIKFYEKEHAEKWYKEVFQKNIENKDLLSEDVNYHLFSSKGSQRKYLRFNREHPYLVRKMLLGENI